YMDDEEINDGPEFAFVGRKCVSELDIHRAIDRMLEDTPGDSDLDVTPEDQAALQVAVDGCVQREIRHDTLPARLQAKGEG
ncbi:hypothetical protein, partial [Streptococcus pneumoniae]|uniref:hypothetical protein n=1 Tax=Streptococcus pneumoniae TaxID=1313 RepID=UPI001E5D7DAA